MSTATAQRLADAISSDTVSGRMWLYSNYHCNLACAYCLTESAPKVPARQLDGIRMVGLAQDAAQLGFTELGVTGGEPFLRSDLPDLLRELADHLPVTVLTNGTLFTRRLLERMRPLAHLPVALQISLDRPDPDDNDLMRAPDNFRKLVDAIPRLVERGLEVRIATTLLEETPASSPGSATCTAASASPTSTMSYGRSYAAAGPKPETWACSPTTAPLKPS